MVAVVAGEAVHNPNGELRIEASVRGHSVTISLVEAASRISQGRSSSIVESIRFAYVRS